MGTTKNLIKILTWNLDETNFLNNYLQNQMSETKKNLDEKNFAIINGVPEFTPRVLFGAWETKVSGTSFPPSEVNIHELFKPTT